MRPDCLPLAASRLPRVWVARGSMPYSAVTQPWPLAAQPGRHAFLDAGGDQHMGVAELDQARAFGMGRKAGDHLDGAHLVGGAAGGAHGAFLHGVGCGVAGQRRDGNALSRRGVEVRPARALHSPHAITFRRRTRRPRPRGVSPGRRRLSGQRCAGRIAHAGQAAGRSACRRRRSATPCRTLRSSACWRRRTRRAGRLPTQLGLRIFVDGMLQASEPSDDERAAIEAGIAEDRHRHRGCAGAHHIGAVGPVAMRRAGAGGQARADHPPDELRAAVARPRA